jgi:hypothetical protein
MSGKGGVLIISDTADAAAERPRYHDRGSPFADRANFVEKVVDARRAGRIPNGRYFWAATARTAGGGARRCEHEADPLNW